MSDLIFRSAALKSLGEPPHKWPDNEYEIGLQVQWASDFNAIKSVPPAQPKRKKGKWKKVMRITETKDCVSYDPIWYCGNCGKPFDPHMAQFINFCPKCGEDLREGRDE